METTPGPLLAKTDHPEEWSRNLLIKESGLGVESDAAQVFLDRSHGRSPFPKIIYNNQMNSMKAPEEAGASHCYDDEGD